MIIDLHEFNTILKREESNRDLLPEHTLDWNIYSNRVALLKEVEALFVNEPEPVVATVAVAKKAVPEAKK